MPQYFKQHGERLAELGYRIVPLPLGSKGPNRKGWPKFELTAPTIRQWAANGSAHDGIGVLAATTPAIDVDILDPQVAQQMSDAIDAIFPGQALMTRTGRAPKFLIPFRSDEPFRKISSAVYTDGQNEHKVEILGDGQQWVAYHTHPDTGLPYTWFNGVDADGIRTVERGELPTLTRNDAQRVIDAFEVLAAERVASGQWSRRVAVLQNERTADADPFAADAPPVGKPAHEVEALLNRLPNDDCDYDRWFHVLCAVHHELGDAGEEIAQAWSANSFKHVDEVFAAKWASLGRYTGRQITLRSLLKETAEEHKPRLPNSGFVQAARFASGQSVEWHIKHVLPKRGLIVIYGEPGSSKSFFALDMVAHVARGIEWRGHRVKQSSVAYIAAEGVAGFGNRLAAYAKHNDVPLTEVPVFVRGGAFELKDMYLEACAEINGIGNVGIVVIDTLAAVTPGANENTSEDMGAAIDAAQRIIEATGASVILIHHTNNQGALRGWSGLRGAVDNQIRIERKDGLRTAHIEKQKEGAEGPPSGYRLKVIELYTDEDGDPVTSCVIVPDEETVPNTRGAKKERKSTSGDFETSDKYAKARKYLEIIQDISGLGDANVDEEDVIQAVQADETVNPLKEPDHPRPDNIKRTLLTLAERGKIRKEGRWIRVCG